MMEKCRPVDQYSMDGVADKCLPHTGINLAWVLVVAVTVIVVGLAAWRLGKQGA